MSLINWFHPPEIEMLNDTWEDSQEKSFTFLDKSLCIYFDIVRKSLLLEPISCLISRIDGTIIFAIFITEMTPHNTYAYIWKS